MERKAAIVRFWFLLAAVALLGLWEPCLWFGVVPMFFFPGCACCCTHVCADCVEVDGTKRAPCQVLLVIPTVTGTLCAECPDFTGEYLIDTDWPTVDCRWTYTLDPEICGMDKIVVFTTGTALAVDITDNSTFLARYQGAGYSPAIPCMELDEDPVDLDISGLCVFPSQVFVSSVGS